MTEAIHLTTSTSFLESLNLDYSNLIIEKFMESCLKLDASIFEPFMAEEEVFEEKNKYLFLDDLKKLFRNHSKIEGHSTVVTSLTKCKGCSWGKPVLLFRILCENKEIDSFGFVIEKSEGVLKDIFICNFYNDNL